MKLPLPLFIKDKKEKEGEEKEEKERLLNHCWFYSGCVSHQSKTFATGHTVLKMHQVIALSLFLHGNGANNIHANDASNVDELFRDQRRFPGVSRLDTPPSFLSVTLHVLFNERAPCLRKTDQCLTLVNCLVQMGHWSDQWTISFLK